jgi:subtilase family serine protease
MTRHLVTRTLAALVALSLVACGGSSSVPVSPIAPATALPTSAASTTSGGTVPYGQHLLSGATYVGAANLKGLGVDLYVPMRDAAGLETYARAASTPGNALYRHWLTPQQLGDRFGADATSYANLVASLNAQHLAVKQYPQRQMVRIRGAQADVQRVLGTTFGFYRKGKTLFLAPASAPKPLASLRVTAIGDAVAYTLRHRNFVPVRASSSFIEGYSPQQIANAFDYTGAYAAGYKGDGITIGIIGTGPITDGYPGSTGVGDVQDYRKLYNVSGNGTVKQDFDLNNVSPGTGMAGTSYSSGLASPPPVTSPNSSGCVSQGYSTSGDPSQITDYTSCNPEDTEAQLDTEQAATLAPDATVNFYIAYNPVETFCTAAQASSSSSANCSAPSQQLGLVLSDDEIQQAIADNQSDIISMSFGSDELDNNGFYFGGGAGGAAGSNGYGPTELASLLAEGIAIFVSSGDSGADACQGTTNESIAPDQACVSYPATDPSVVSVGGVNAPLNDAGTIVGPVTGWGVATQNTSVESPGGSGGGCSIFFQAPTYETALGSSLCNGTRTQPDMSLDGDTNTGVAVDTNADPSLGGRLIQAVGGTSVAAPEMAAMWALVLEACKNTSSCASQGSGSTPYRLGNPNPYLFPLVTSNSTANGQNYGSTFLDVQFGNNALPSTTGSNLDPGYSAGVGYDLVTGLGVPFARNVIKYVVGV